MSEIADRYTRIADTFDARLKGVTKEQWDAATPCSEWTVRDLVGHVVGVHGMMRGSLEGSAPPEPDVKGDLVAQWEGATAFVRAALGDRDRATKVVSGPTGEQPFEEMVGRLLCADTLFHTWDLARATGQDENLDAEAVAKAQEFLDPIDEMIRRPGAFDPKITPPEGADAQTRLLCFGGRRI